MHVRALLFGAGISAIALAQGVEWTPRVSLEGNIFPSYILAISNFPHQQNKDHSVGDGDGSIDVLVKTNAPNSKIKIHIESPNSKIILPTDYEISLPEAGIYYTINPPVNWSYEGLSRVKITQPTNVIYRFSVNGGPIETKTVVARLRSINDCMFGYKGAHGAFVDTSWAYAAYVDETNPGIDWYLRSMLNTGLINQVSGYQEGGAGVYRQVFALWDVLLRSGFRYSNIASMPEPGGTLFVQQVRLLNDSMRTAQSNCVDGTVVMASILEKAGIHCFLCLVPGHCFLGFYLDEQGTQPALLETTMMGGASVAMAQVPEAGSFGSLFSPTTKQSVAWQSFNAAVQYGAREYERNRILGQLRIVDIPKLRQIGIAPINISPQ